MGGALRIALTGGYGFVGKHIVAALHEQFPEARIHVLDKDVPRSLAPELARLIAQSYQVDITIAEDVNKVMEVIRPDVVVHTAGINPPLQERYLRRIEKLVRCVNVGGTNNVLTAARESGCNAFVYTSSCCVVTDDLHGSFANIDERWPVSHPSLMYGETKVAAEALVLAADGKDMATCVLRPSVIFGEGDPILVPAIHACIAKGETPFRLGDGLNLWDTAYVGNVAFAHALAVKNLLTTKSAHGEAMFIQNNEPISFRDFCLAIWEEFGHTPRFEVQIPARFGYFVGYVAELWTRLSGGTTTISRGSVLDACAIRYASGDKARRLLGYEARISLPEGLRRACEEYASRLTVIGVAPQQERLSDGDCKVSAGHAAEIEESNK